LKISLKPAGTIIALTLGEDAEMTIIVREPATSGASHSVIR